MEDGGGYLVGHEEDVEGVPIQARDVLDGKPEYDRKKEDRDSTDEVTNLFARKAPGCTR